MMQRCWVGLSVHRSIIIIIIANVHLALVRRCPGGAGAPPWAAGRGKGDADISPMALWRRVRESDSGARMLRIVHHVYISRLLWTVAVHPTVKAVQHSEAEAAEAGSDEASGCSRPYCSHLDRPPVVLSSAGVIALPHVLQLAIALTQS